GDRDRGPEPGALLRAQAPLPPAEGGGPGGAVHDPARRGAPPPRGRGHQRDHLGRDGAHGRRGGPAAGRRGRLGRGARPAHGDAVGPGGRAGERAEDLEGARPARGHAHRRLRGRDRGDDRRGGVRVARRAGEADRRAGCAGAVLAAAREGLHPPGRDGRRRAAGARRLLMSTGTLIEVVMPQMGVSVSEGTIVKWLRAEGETIEADEPLLEISTDKVDTEVPSPGTGIVARILVQEGETVDVGTKLAEIAPEGAVPAAETAPAEPAPEPATAGAAAEAGSASSAETTAPAAEPAPEPAAAPAPPPTPAAADASANGKSFVSPVVARIAAEHGVDVAAVPGTGQGGRVTKKDILAFIESGPPPAAAPAPPAPAAPAPAV